MKRNKFFCVWIKLLIFVITLLFVKGIIPMKLFITLLIIVTGLTSCAIVFIIKKLDP